MITANAVKELRERTGVGMMDCKKALVETDGDIDKAIEYLREKGLASNAKKAGRIAAEGAVQSYITSDGKQGAIAEVNCETDFVAKTDEFISMVKDVAEQIVKKGAENVENLLNEPFFKDGGKTVDMMVNEKAAKIGEKIAVRRFASYQLAASGIVESYIHMGGKIGVLIEVACGSDAVASKSEFKSFVRDLAMQIAASKPTCLIPSDVPQEELENEKTVLKAQALNEGKPEAIVEKMVMGRISKYYSQVCLMEQEFVKDTDKKIKAYVKEKEKEFDTNIVVKRFARFEMGEGLQKREDDFVSEVMKQAGM